VSQLSSRCRSLTQEWNRTESLTNDVTLSKEKPLWPLSSYGAAKHEKVLVGGLDESPEELRVKAVAAVKDGTINDYVSIFSIDCANIDMAVQMKYEAEKIAAADQIYTNARNNISQFHDQAIKLSHGISSSIIGSAFGGSVFGSSSDTSSATANPNPTAFGGTATSTFGQTAFGQSGFGTVATSSVDFGQGTSAFGAAQPVSVFGQPTQMPSALAQPQTTSAFGQTPAFGQQSQPTSAFGQSSQATIGFGQPSNPTSAFGQSPQPSSAFGQAPQTTSLFGQSSLIKPASSPFGSTTPNTSVFGNTNSGGFFAFASQPSGFSAAASTSVPSAAASGSVFGQPTFSAAAPAQPAQAQSVFPSVIQPTFGPSLTPTSTLAASSPMSAFPTGSPFGGTRKPSSTGPDFALAKSRVRPKLDGDRFTSLLPPNYSDILPADVKAAFMSEKFEWGKIPEWIPPKEVRY